MKQTFENYGLGLIAYAISYLVGTYFGLGYMVLLIIAVAIYLYKPTLK